MATTVDVEIIVIRLTEILTPADVEGVKIEVVETEEMVMLEMEAVVAWRS